MSERVMIREIDADSVRALAKARGIGISEADHTAAESRAVISRFVELAGSLRPDEDIYRFRRLLEESATV